MLKKIFFCALFQAALESLFCQVNLNSFSDALKIAVANDLERSLQMQSAQENVRMARKNVEAFLPVIDFSISDAAKAQRDTEDAKNKAIEIGITQKIFNGGKTLLEWRMQKEKSFYQFLSAQKSCENFQNQLLQCYYNALLLKLKSEVLRSNLDNVGQVVETARLEESQGMITRTEYLETLLEFKKMELEAKKALDDFEGAEEELKRMMNLKREHKINLLESEAFEAALKNFSIVEGLKERSLECSQNSIQRSLDLKLAAAELNWAQKMRSMQKRFMIPSVSVRGGLSFSGRNYPLNSPTYSIKVILSFDDNPWLVTSISRQNTFNKGKMNSISDGISGQTKANTIYFSQMRLNKIEIEQKKLGVEKVKKQIERDVLEIIRKIERAQENFLLNLENVEIKEQKVFLSKLQLEQGSIKKSDYLEEMNECAKQKIQCLSFLKERDYWTKELEAMAALKL